MFGLLLSLFGKAPTRAELIKIQRKRNMFMFALELEKKNSDRIKKHKEELGKLKKAEADTWKRRMKEMQEAMKDSKTFVQRLHAEIERGIR
jgi:hypothetical protein